ncbi:Internalin-A [Jeotgalibaca dankookensis]|uniref:Internalin-A n=1 Tax=Jeotgalibaca dankookensis TaxID=708126 RepID=A0A1S6IS00_9LACT|nr:CotH kinase family protein [Jeotgalibaca dankookensis]AQS54299.1 Internalin-A [Jeotgalibaca dankookensis]
MRKKYTKFNLISLLVILFSLFFLVLFFNDSTTVVNFSDPGLEAAVRETIEKEEGTLHTKDVDTVQVLDAANHKIEKLDGIEYLTQLRELNLEDNFIESVSPLKNLTKLETLNLRNNEITNLEDIHFQDIIYLNIRDLSLRHNVKRDQEGHDTRLADISLVGKMASLRKLSLRDNDIEDLAPISALRKLTELDIRENKFDTLEPLETLNKLKKLNIRDNQITSLEPIRYLSRLTYLNIHSDTEIESLEPIKELINLETLIMRNILIQDASFLKPLVNLQNFNGIDTGIEKGNSELIEGLLAKGALQGDVRPERMLHTLSPPVLSQESGFYNQDLAIEIENKSNVAPVYYTLDGSEPTVNSEIYKEPIVIDNKSNQIATVLRARTLSETNAMSETVTKTYFVEENIEERFDLPIFSLVTDPVHLFDEETGIYTDENAYNRGSDWERPLHIEFFEPNGALALSQNGGVRINGGATRAYAQKSLRLYAGSEYDEEEYFNYPFFGDLKQKNSPQTIDSFKRLILRNSGNDWSQTMFNDALMQSLVKPLGTVATQAYQPAVIFVNGEYYGIQNIRERYDEYYFESHYGIAPDDLVVLENNAELYEGSNKDVYHYKNMLKYIEEHDIKEKEHLDYVETLMDFENFIDYFASEIYFGNLDWPQNNIRYWRKTIDFYRPEAPYGHDGRWRWMMNDTDFGFYFRTNASFGYNEEPINHETNSIKWVMGEKDGRLGERIWPNFLFRQLMQNDTFKNQFINRFNDLVNSYLSESVADKQIEALKNGIDQEISYQIDRWGAIESKEKWEENINRKYLFAKERPEYIRNYMMEEFDIDDTVTVTVNNETEAGYVRVNTLAIQSDLPGNARSDRWSGIYFKGIPITIEAVAKDGYEFSHWEDHKEDVNELTITPEENINFEAVFKKK